MINNSEDANKYYKLINGYIDEYVEKHKIDPLKLKKYLKNNQKMISFLKRKGLNDIKNINRVLDDIIDDRISIEKDLVKNFESYKVFESNIFNINDCIDKGVDVSNITHEKIIADYFDISLSHINIINSNKHIFEVETLNGKLQCIVFNNNDINIIKENLKEYYLNKFKNYKLKVDTIDILSSLIVDDKKLEEHLELIINDDEVFKFLSNQNSCKGIKIKDNFIGLK